MTTTTVTRRYHFESAHWLPKVPDTHKCHRMHGHNYTIDVTVAGDVDDTGFIVDFWDMDAVIKPIIDRIDHRLLNEIAGLDNPTAENIASWFAWQITSQLDPERHLYIVTNVRVYEVLDSCWADFSPVHSTNSTI